MSDNKAISIFLVDDQDLFRAGLKMMLGSQVDLEVVGEARNGFEALRLIPQVNPQVVLMDIRMPDLNGLEATRQLVAHYRSTGRQCPSILVLTTLDTEETARQSLEAGATGFMLKNTEPEFLIAAIRALPLGTHIVATSGTPIVPTVKSIPAEFERLTERERDVFRELSHGLNNREIAATLFLSEATIKTHLTAILQKLQLRDRVQLVVYAYTNGIVD